MPWKWYDGVLCRMESPAPDLRRLWLQLTEEEHLAFRAGQFVTMDLPIHEKRLKRWRSYSIASAPPQDQLLEFCIGRLEGGAASGYFFETVQIGDAIRFKGPDGNFTLPDNLENCDLVFICTGTGIAPFRSMLLDIQSRHLVFRSIHLIFGTRYAEGILYREEMEKMMQEMPNFKYSVALSREQEINPNDFSFSVSKGYVHQIYLEAYSESMQSADFFLCGWSNMIDDAVANLTQQLGCDKSRIRYELYG